MQGFPSISNGIGKRVRGLAPSFASSLFPSVLLAAGVLFAGCGGAEDEAAGRQPLDEQTEAGGGTGGTGGSCDAPGECFSCRDLLDAPCLCKKSPGGATLPCEGAALAACKAEHEEQYETCRHTEQCERTVLEPALAQCPPKSAPGSEACVHAAYVAYAACVGSEGDGTAP